MDDSRAAIREQIAYLQQKLVQLDSLADPNQTSTSSSPKSGALTTTASASIQRHVSTGKKIVGEKIVHTLPPSLARAPKRHIALLFCYEGWAHSGLAYQKVHTPLPTVEKCILDALETSRLIQRDRDSEAFGCGFERCGRTDAGVSSSAQVINLWVRSTLPDPMAPYHEKQQKMEVDGYSNGNSNGLGELGESKVAAGEDAKEEVTRRPANVVEMPYTTIINNHLPPTIRILAWSPVSPEFSSRFSCIWRHYKYFFSRSLTKPFLESDFDMGEAYRESGSSAAKARDWQAKLKAIDWGGVELDIDLMREAASKLVGEHDFRNFCKVDAPKQLSSHQRTVISASIDKLEEEGPDMFVLNLRGGAFLYNQVRHIMAILFMVGARLEQPDIVTKLLWTSDRTENTNKMHPESSENDRNLMDRKPGYPMADDLPLILWQCGYNDTEFDWRIDNRHRAEGGAPQESNVNGKSLSGQHYGNVDPVDIFRRQFLHMGETWTQNRIKAIILKHHVAAYSALVPSPLDMNSNGKSMPSITPHGAGKLSITQTYRPLLKRQLGDLPEETNRRWAEGRGASRMAARLLDQERSGAARKINLEKKERAKQLAESIQHREML